MAKTKLDTFNNVVIASFDGHIRNRDELQLRVLLSVEMVQEPLGLLRVAHRAADIVAFFQKPIDDVASNETVYPGDEDGRTRLDSDVRHAANKWKGKNAEVSGKGVRIRVS